METRVCGSPAVDGYQRVNISCLLQSPTARWFRGYTAAGGRYEDMVVHIEQQADYDGELPLSGGLLLCPVRLPPNVPAGWWSLGGSRD